MVAGALVLGAQDYPADWETSDRWDSRLDVRIERTMGSGCDILFKAADHPIPWMIRVGAVNHPFWEWERWLHAVANGQLPATLERDDEGDGHAMKVCAYAGAFQQRSDLEFRITDWRGEWGSDDDPQTVFLLRCRRTELLQAFVGELDRWLQRDYARARWDEVPRYDTWAPGVEFLRDMDTLALWRKIPGGRLSGRMSPAEAMRQYREVMALLREPDGTYPADALASLTDRADDLRRFIFSHGPVPDPNWVPPGT
jgi:hypothetical protein